MFSERAQGGVEPSLYNEADARVLARELAVQRHEASDWLVRQLLYDMGYSLQSNHKTKEGAQHPDRDDQFRYINARVTRHLRRGGPAISVDTKKKELVREYKNGGREWRPQGARQRVRVHDFIDPKQGKSIPYRIYDLALNKGWVAVGVDHDTASFVVNTIRRWWTSMGSKTYPRATSLLVVADSGGSGSRLRLWKWELQRLADDTRLTIHVSHLPPGTSKWNKIEHRLFSFISQNWRGQPLLSHTTIVKLIANTRTSAGLTVRCILDRRRYPTDVRISEQQMATLRLRPDSFHGDGTMRSNRTASRLCHLFARKPLVAMGSVASSVWSVRSRGITHTRTQHHRSRETACGGRSCQHRLRLSIGQRIPNGLGCQRNEKQPAGECHEKPLAILATLLRGIAFAPLASAHDCDGANGTPNFDPADPDGTPRGGREVPDPPATFLPTTDTR